MSLHATTEYGLFGVKQYSGQSVLHDLVEIDPFHIVEKSVPVLYMYQLCMCKKVGYSSSGIAGIHLDSVPINFQSCQMPDCGLL